MVYFIFEPEIKILSLKKITSFLSDMFLKEPSEATREPDSGVFQETRNNRKIGEDAPSLKNPKLWPPRVPPFDSTLRHRFLA